jgi:hypothetical protein
VPTALRPANDEVEPKYIAQQKNIAFAGKAAYLISAYSTRRRGLSLARGMGPPDCQGDGTTVARY